METEALDLARQLAIDNQTERLSWGVIEFQVIDLERTVAFWTNALGLHIRRQSAKRVELGTKTKTLFTFNSGASIPVGAKHSGMYHVAIGVPDQQEFSRILARLVSLNIPVSPVDHLMSKAIYLHDPDGLEIEIAFETPERFGRFGDMSKGLVLYTADGQPHNGRSALDTKAELSFAQDADLQAPMSNEAHIAHMHFKVPDLEKATSWFEGIGFARNLMLPHFGFADMGAGASYTHRLAMNIWAGPDQTPAPEDMTRLIHYTLHVHDPAVMHKLTNLQSSEKGTTGIDPSGTQLSLVFEF